MQRPRRRLRYKSGVRARAAVRVRLCHVASRQVEDKVNTGVVDDADTEKVLEVPPAELQLLWRVARALGVVKDHEGVVTHESRSNYRPPQSYFPRESL